MPFDIEPGEVFDANSHQLMDESLTPQAGARIGSMVATGYTFQGRLLRRAVVRLRQEAPESSGMMAFPHPSAEVATSLTATPSMPPTTPAANDPSIASVVIHPTPEPAAETIAPSAAPETAQETPAKGEPSSGPKHIEQPTLL